MAALSQPHKLILELCRANAELGLYVVRLQCDLAEAKGRIVQLEAELSAARSRNAEIEGRERTSAEPAQKGTVNNGNEKPTG